jgi:hypothetical protein
MAVDARKCPSATHMTRLPAGSAGLKLSTISDIDDASSDDRRDGGALSGMLGLFQGATTRATDATRARTNLAMLGDSIPSGAADHEPRVGTARCQGSR